MIVWKVCLECAANNLGEKAWPPLVKVPLAGALVMSYLEARAAGAAKSRCVECGRDAILCALERGAVLRGRG